MALPVTDRTIKVEIRYLWGSERVENVLHFRHTIDNPSTSNMQALADALIPVLASEFAPLMSVSVLFRELYMESYDGDISVALTQPLSGGGSNVNQSLPYNSALCISLRSAFVGRSRRGRFYTVGMTEGDQSGSIVSSGYMTDWQAALTTLMAAASLEGWELGILSTVADGVPRTTGLFTPCSALVVVDNVVDSQRRRLPGRGR